MDNIKHDPWIETRTGIKFNFLNPKEDQINIRDIAYALANTCRFNGHSSSFYSVAEHSVAVADRCSEPNKLGGLLHDAAEAYLSDIPSPIKQFLPEYKKLEQKVQKCIFDKYGIKDHWEIKQADLEQLSTEAYYLLPSQGVDWQMWDNINMKRPIPNKKYRPLGLPPEMAYKLFTACFEHLTKSPIVLLNKAA